MDGGAWRATVHGVAKRQTRLSDFTFFLSFFLSLGGLVIVPHRFSMLLPKLFLSMALGQSTQFRFPVLLIKCFTI